MLVILFKRDNFDGQIIFRIPGFGWFGATTLGHRWCLLYGQWTVSKWERVNRASLPKVIIHYAESRRMCTSTISTLILHNKSLHNELHHLFPSSLTGFSSPPNQNLNLHKAAQFNVKRGCRTNKTHCSKSLLHFCGEAGKTGERDRERDRESINKTWLHDFPTSKRRTQEGALPEQ